MNDYEEPYSIVFNCGSGYIKAGFTGDETPKTIIPSVVGTFRKTPIMMGIGPRDYYVGEEALYKQQFLALNHPMINYNINNWKHIQALFEHTLYYELRAPPEDYSMLFTKTHLMNINEIKKLTELMFETFEIPFLKFENETLLSLFASGRSNGVIVDCGYYSIRSIPIIEGNIQFESITQTNYGGSDLNNYLYKLLTENGINVPFKIESDIIKDIKERLCYISNDWNKDIQMNKSDYAKSYLLPDNTSITIDNLQFKCPEALFKPNLIDSKQKGIHEIITTSINLCNEMNKKDLFRNIVLTGGTSLFPNIQNRLQKEMNELIHCNYQSKIISQNKRQFLAWIGGSILSSLSSFQQLYLDKKVYDESGFSYCYERQLI